MQSENKVIRFISRLAIVVVVVVVYAVGLQVTQVDLKKPQEERRQDQLTNILRGLAHPDVIAYTIDRLEVDVPILIPCQPPGPVIPPAETLPRITLSTNCAQPGDKITVSGEGFRSRESIFLYFVPYTARAEDEVELKLVDSTIKADAAGRFEVVVELRRDRTSENLQRVRAVVNRRVGGPHPSQALIETLDKIVETVFLALIATTLGVVFAVPFSFLAARNLMLEVSTSFSKLMASLVALPIGGILGYLATQWVYSQLAMKAWFLYLEAPLVNWGVFGNLLIIGMDAIFLGLPLLVALAGAVGASSLLSRGTGAVVARTSGRLSKVVGVLVAALAGIILLSIIAAILNWFYQFGHPATVLLLPSLLGALSFGAMGVIYDPDRPIPSGMFIYYIVRTIMNGFRSIEPLVMVVAFAVWVGIGPFAGVMALLLHTVVALGKLYSEQVESIATGPIEAVTATGANRLQMIIYAVIPQIVPPYIAFTLYRWDINVRMSTIIGFGGGGGIGFLLSQNINLLKYRQASVNMLAIASVVATLDYVSAKVRERIT